MDSNDIDKSISQAEVTFRHHSGEDQETVLRGKIAEYIIAGGFVLILMVGEWTRAILKAPPHPIWVTVFATSLLIYIGVRIWMLWPQLKMRKQIRLSRLMVRSDIGALSERGYFFFEDLMGPRGKILGDILVGPNGLFSIEQKTYSRKGTHFEKLEESENGTLVFAGREVLADPIGQASKAAEIVGTFLESETQKSFGVQPILLFPGWPLGEMKEKRSVWVANEQTLAERIASSDVRLETSEIIEICSVLDRQKMATN